MFLTIFFVAIGFTLTALAVFFINRQRVEKKYYVHHQGSKYSQLGDVKLHYVFETRGEATGRAFLLLHGLAANVYCWRKFIPKMAGSARVWALDLKGFGHSDKPWPSDYGLQAQAELVAQFIEKEIKGKCVIVGSSMGGAIALEIALNRSELVDGLVLISPAYDASLVWLDVRKFKALMPLSRFFANPLFVKNIIRSVYGTDLEVTVDDVNAYMNPYMDKNARHALVDAFGAITDSTLKDRIIGVRCPTLIVWGKKDRVTPVAYAPEIQKLIPNAHLAVHEEAGHHLQEEEPEWLANVIQRLFK